MSSRRRLYHTRRLSHRCTAQAAAITIKIKRSAMPGMIMAAALFAVQDLAVLGKG